MIKISIPSIVFNQLSEVSRRGRNAKRRLMNRSTPLNEAKDYMVQRWDVNFDGHGSIYGAWPELNEEWTVAERGSSAPILVRTGSLWTHFMEQNEDGVVDPTSIVWEFNNADPAFTVSHNDGYPNPIAGHNPIPPRKLWDFNSEDEAHIQNIFEVWCSQVIDQEFG